MIAVDSIDPAMSSWCMLTIRKLVPSDRAAWQALFEAYMTFYERTLAAPMYERAWTAFQADTDMHALAAERDGRLIGITHFLVHANTSAADVCYLQDLFTAPDQRGQGVGRALIVAVADWARGRACSRLYWMTHESNAVARRLYDAVAVNRGFIRYQMDLDR